MLPQRLIASSFAAPLPSLKRIAQWKELPQSIAASPWGVPRPGGGGGVSDVAHMALCAFSGSPELLLFSVQKLFS